MTLDEAAKILRKMYDHGYASKEQSTQVHLFGIKYADVLDGMPLKEIASRAGISEAYQTEIRKGMKLSKYVRVVD